MRLMLLRSAFSLIVLLGFGSLASAAVVYDWSFEAQWQCGGTNACSNFRGSSIVSGAGTFTTETTDLGTSGILTPSDLQDIVSYTASEPDLFQVVRDGGTGVVTYWGAFECSNQPL